MSNTQTGALNWRLSAHPITLCCYLAFRLASIFTYLFGLWFSSSFILIFIVVVLLLSADFYYTKNIAGRRLVFLRWWNETIQAPPPSPSSTTQTPSQPNTMWVFESPSESQAQSVNATDSRFFWIALYSAPIVWILLAVVAIVRLEFVWLSLVVVAGALSLTNALAFSRADQFSNASSIAGSALGGAGGGLLSGLMGKFAGRWFGRL